MTTPTFDEQCKKFVKEEFPLPMTIQEDKIARYWYHKGIETANTKVVLLERCNAELRENVECYRHGGRL